MQLFFGLSLRLILLASTLAFVSPGSVLGQQQKKPRKKKAKTERASATMVITPESSALHSPFTGSIKITHSENKTIAAATARCKKFDGLFTLFQDTVDGSAFILLKKAQFEKEYIYTSTVVDGVADLNLFRGNFRDNKIFKIKRHFNRVEFVQENLNFYFDPNNALSRAADANILHSILSSHNLVAREEDKGLYLIKADELFLTEFLHQVKTGSALNFPMSPGFSLGSLNRDKSKYLHIKGYPENTDVVVEYVYDSPVPNSRAGKDVADARYVSIKLQHSLIEMPKNNFQPRFDDARVGYFITQTTDMTSKSATPYRDVIHRWHLEKKDPAAALSEPVEPIVFWIENTTPVELRETIRRAALSWNQAFEKAGFQNALQVKVQPDDAAWDAGDIRYNVLRWASSPNPSFGGYGPSFVNPRTGQIIGADIMLEYVFLTNRLNQEQVFDVAALPLSPQHTTAEEQRGCTLGLHLHHANLFGMAALTLLADEEEEEKVALKERESYTHSSIYFLVLHEIGHTLGLNHNMRASTMLAPAELADKQLALDKGLTGSVMDYPAVNLSLDKSKQGLYFTSKPGPYDQWAIEFGYAEALKDEAAEQARLSALLARSSEPALAFGNDSDDMRAPGRGIDPRVMIGDMSSDAIQYASDRILLANALTGRLKTRYAAKKNQSYHELRNSYLILTGEVGTAAGIISRYIGGVYLDRSVVGQSETAQPFTPVAYKDQKRALQALNHHVFSPMAVTAPHDLYPFLQMQRRGFSGGNEDPQLHDRVLAVQKGVFSHLLHPAVLKRINDTGQYGNSYSLSEFMGDLTQVIFAADLRGNVNSYRQNLQAEYVTRLLGIAGQDNKLPTYDYHAQATAYYNLQQIKKLLATHPGGDLATKAHRQHLLFLIGQGLQIKGE